MSEKLDGKHGPKSCPMTKFSIAANQVCDICKGKGKDHLA